MISTPDLAQRLGITYRRLDHVARTTLGIDTGSGRHRRWTRDEAARWTAAVALDNATPRSSTLHDTTAAAWASAPPPTHGWAILEQGIITYAHTRTDLAHAITDAAIVAYYDSRTLTHTTTTPAVAVA